MATQQDLIDELDAFNPRWREVYSTVSAAAAAAGVTELYEELLRDTIDLRRTRDLFNVPDYRPVREEPSESLPYSYDNIGLALAQVDSYDEEEYDDDSQEI